MTTLVVQWGTSLVLALATLIAGLFVAGVIGRLLGKVLDCAQVVPSLRSFLTSLTSILLKVMVYITALGVLGIEMTSFVAILAVSSPVISLRAVAMVAAAASIAVSSKPWIVEFAASSIASVVGKG